MKPATALLSLCFFLGSHASAQGYVAAEEKQRFCRQTGQLWQEAFEYDTAMGKTLKQFSDDRAAGKITPEEHMHFVMIFISAKAGRFGSGSDAYMAGWANCMDGRK